MNACGCWPGSQAFTHTDPGERSVTAHVHARGLTADRAADSIAGQLVRADVLAAQPAQRNAAELVGQVQRAAEHGGAAPVIVVDGLDEARGQAFTMAEELLLRLAPYATVIVSTRELRRRETEPSLLDMLTAGATELDLDDPAAQERGRIDMRAYIAGRLAGVDPRMDPDAVARYLAEGTSMTGDSPFLLARLVTDQLCSAPVDTSVAGWEDRVSDSVEGAFNADLARVGPGRAELARRLLAALTWGFGAGLPEEEWLACGSALGDGPLGRDDVTWVLDELGRYIVQDGEAGVAVYRIAHQSLADHIRPPFAASYEQVFDPQARPIAAVTLGTPYRGAARALDQLVNGAHQGLGPFRLDLTMFGRSMPSLHQLMPEYACLQQGGDLVRTTSVTLPELGTGMVADAMRFHTDLQEAEAGRPQSLAATHAIVGTTQPTATTARLADGRIELLGTYQDQDLAGDATVPIVGACRADVRMDSNTLRRVPDKHGNLQRNPAALDEVEGILTASSIIVKAAKPVALRVDAPEFALAGEPVIVRVTPAERARQAIHLTVTSETGIPVEVRRLRPSGESITLDGLPPGAYTIDVTGPDAASPYAPISSDILIWESTAAVPGAE